MKKRLLALALSAAMVLSVLSGCSSKPDPKKLLEDAMANTDQVKTQTITLKMKIGAEGNATDSASMSMDMNMDMDIIATQNAMFIKMDMALSELMKVNEELYIDLAGKRAYLKNTAGWQQAPIDDSTELGSLLQMASMGSGNGDTAQATNPAQSLAALNTVAKDMNVKGTKTFAGQNCYELEMTLNAENIMNLASTFSGLTGTTTDANAYASMTDEEKAAIEKAMETSPINFYIGKNDNRLYGLNFDFSPMMKSLMGDLASDSDDVTLKDDLTMVMTMETDYEKENVEIPAEAKAGAEVDFAALSKSSMMLQAFGAQSSALGSDAILGTDDAADNDTDYPVSVSDVHMVASQEKLTETVTSYKTDATELVCTANVELGDEKKKTTAKVEWFIINGGQEAAMDTAEEVVEADKQIYSVFKPTTTFPAGSYRVKVTCYQDVNGTETQVSKTETVDFTIE